MGGGNGAANGGQQVVVHLSRISGRPLVLAGSANSNLPCARPDDTGLFERRGRRTCHRRLNDVPSKRSSETMQMPHMQSHRPRIHSLESGTSIYFFAASFFLGVSGLSPIAAGRWNLGHSRIIFFLALSPMYIRNHARPCIGRNSGLNGRS